MRNKAWLFGSKHHVLFIDPTAWGLGFKIDFQYLTQIRVELNVGPVDLAIAYKGWPNNV